MLTFTEVPAEHLAHGMHTNVGSVWFPWQFRDYSPSPSMGCLWVAMCRS